MKQLHLSSAVVRNPLESRSDQIPRGQHFVAQQTAILGQFGLLSDFPLRISIGSKKLLWTLGTNEFCHAASRMLKGLAEHPMHIQLGIFMRMCKQYHTIQSVQSFRSTKKPLAAMFAPPWHVRPGHKLHGARWLSAPRGSKDAKERAFGKKNKKSDEK